MKQDLPACDRCEDCVWDRSKKHNGMTYYCPLLDNRDIGQSHFGHNSPRDCPKREHPRPAKCTPIVNRNPIQLERSGVSGIPVLSGDFNRGYTKAIMDVSEVFSYIQDDLRHHHKNLTAKNASELLKCILQHREQLREQHLSGGKGFIRYNGKTQKFEWFEGR